MESIQSVLINRDGLTPEEAQKCVDECAEDLRDRIAQGEMPFDICEEYFGLEPDYLEQLI